MTNLIDAFTEYVCSTARLIATEREHSPMMFLLFPGGEVVPIASQFSNDAEKDAVAAFVRGIAGELKPMALVTVFEAYMSAVPAELVKADEHEIMEDARSRDRDEVLFVHTERPLGKPDLRVARIGVDGGEGPRRLGPWADWPVDMLAGRFASLLDDLGYGDEVGVA